MRKPAVPAIDLVIWPPSVQSARQSGMQDNHTNRGSNRRLVDQVELHSNAIH